MRFLDEKGRLFGKISIIDFIVIVVVIVGVAWFGYARFGRNLGAEIEARQEPVRYAIVIPAIRPTTADALEKGGKVFEFKTGTEIGTIRGVSTAPAEVYTLNQDGTLFKSVTEERVDTIIEIDATATVGDNVITVNGVEVRVGTSIGVTTKWAQVSGYIMTLDILEGSGQ